MNESQIRARRSLRNARIQLALNSVRFGHESIEFHESRIDLMIAARTLRGLLYNQTPALLRKQAG